MENELLGYVAGLGREAFAEGTFEYRSESFLEDYVLLVGGIRYVPEDFDIESYRPEEEPADIIARRDAIITNFMDREAGDFMVQFVLDEWARSGESPEEFLATVDMETLRAVVISRLHVMARFGREVMVPVLRALREKEKQEAQS